MSAGADALVELASSLGFCVIDVPDDIACHKDCCVALRLYLCRPEPHISAAVADFAALPLQPDFYQQSMRDMLGFCILRASSPLGRSLLCTFYAMVQRGIDATQLIDRLSTNRPCDMLYDIGRTTLSSMLKHTLYPTFEQMMHAEYPKKFKGPMRQRKIDYRITSLLGNTLHRESIIDGLLTDAVEDGIDPEALCVFLGRAAVATDQPLRDGSLLAAFYAGDTVVISRLCADARMRVDFMSTIASDTMLGIVLAATRRIDRPSKFTRVYSQMLYKKMSM